MLKFFFHFIHIHVVGTWRRHTIHIGNMMHVFLSYYKPTLSINIIINLVFTYFFFNPNMVLTYIFGIHIYCVVLINSVVIHLCLFSDILTFISFSWKFCSNQNFFYHIFFLFCVGAFMNHNTIYNIICTLLFWHIYSDDDILWDE